MLVISNPIFFEIMGFSHLDFKILDILSEIPSISETWNFEKIAVTKKTIMSLCCFFFVLNIWTVTKR